MKINKIKNYFPLKEEFIINVLDYKFNCWNAWFSVDTRGKIWNLKFVGAHYEFTFVLDTIHNLDMELCFFVYVDSSNA